ncbi:hypothetical protein [Anabaena azotica]|uniref:Uncharacterized protein n=1 Tax=Anabaena azotica FACHB-119 TaxID=947527 RepID=A0ABR8D7J0_9NOST|nr:hypothetical protein [Anabaena azotica]MBD2503140.1 hypothetical protein [Anabaena azotica FACHB-119]
MNNEQQNLEISLAVAAGRELTKFADFLRTIDPDLTTTEALGLTTKFIAELPELVKANPSIHYILEKAAWNIRMSRSANNN